MWLVLDICSRIREQNLKPCEHFILLKIITWNSVAVCGEALSDTSHVTSYSDWHVDVDMAYLLLQHFRECLTMLKHNNESQKLLAKKCSIRMIDFLLLPFAPSPSGANF